MDIEIIGNQQSANEILALTQIWEQALNQHDLAEMTQDYVDNVSVFDVALQIEDVQAYRKLWQQCFPYFGDHIQVFRRKLTIYASDQVVFLHCYSKVLGDAQTSAEDVPWCRTTVGFYKESQKWKVVHEHISMPFDCEKQQPLYILAEP
ncbi:nuclear transport factor 2 family protein [Acinetobacter sp. S40]|uniref:YybH family protein n=1 Tax=unclassified Acinetobacter TaxID=196816 RepID=UPI001909C71C|nr:MULTISPECIES: nuclear transport factor 2 family protein [unclassified Acinetobacter]MBJ9986620.1 nuclear transport factor 2 family protein [Acinetobacter sp. S40]MBK0064925.1 nuclear transport factor 2 family protein [Acinetobacter sp. S55]MBK0068252.1 nuclear transport factor 2 family protein [Acinetobacter sp. S54]